AADAVTISLIRVILVSITFGNAYAFAYSFAGAVLSFVIMWALKKSGKFSPVAVSVAGGVGHNLGQITVAALVLENSGIFLYLPTLILSGTAAGVCIGVVGGIIVQRIRKI
ncbi:MAG: Gx transporter family protein, partial [Oscillospiraceae bacterium]|nr:Gx transporter family protein [Oscillospiraceae bacterium]